MSIRAVLPDHMSPAELDDWLARGWFRVGQAMMTCRLHLVGGGVRTTLWTRQDLHGAGPSKNARRVARLARTRFRVEHGPARVDAAHEALYQRYVAHVGGDRDPTLHDFRHGGREGDLFDTQEVSLWDGDRLVAYSWYDVGVVSMQSLIGVYEPELAAMSLGLATLLLEAEAGRARGLRWFYSGYVLIGSPSMDYKLRVGATEFLDPRTGAWRPWSELAGPFDHEVMVHALDAVEEALQAASVLSHLQVYEAYGRTVLDPRLRDAVDQPWILQVPVPGQLPVGVTWDPETESYRAAPVRTLLAWRTDGSGEPSGTFEILLRQRGSVQSSDPAELARRIARHVARSARGRVL